jgi:pyruvate dehydrogenase E2 component (dihydrolipoamide acetyltransferase)
MPDFKLPDLGEGMTEAEVDRWMIKEGDVVAEDDILVELITDKATAEIPSPFAGTVTKIHVQAGDVVPVGTVLVTIGESGSGAAADDATPSAQTVLETPGAIAPGVSAELAGSGTATSAPPREVKATPPVRKLAAELGVDLAAVSGTGPEGRITREDVELAASGSSSAPQSAEGEKREAVRGVRRTIAERMTLAQRIPAVTHVEECDVTDLEAARKAANLTYMPYIVKAVIAGLKEYPSLNAALDEDKQEIVYYSHYDIGVAVDTNSGLIVPVVHNADGKSLRELADEIEDLAGRARGGKLTMAELHGGTFTVTSPGKFGGLMATPLILHPQTGILGVHRASDRPVVKDREIVVRRMMNLSITFDHRVLDGLTAARFAVDVARMLEDPPALES